MLTEIAEEGSKNMDSNFSTSEHMLLTKQLMIDIPLLSMPDLTLTRGTLVWANSKTWYPG